MDLSLYFSMHAKESAFPLKAVSSSFDLGAFEVADPTPPKLTSISALPEIALVAAVTASFIISGWEFLDAIHPLSFFYIFRNRI